MSPLGSPPRKSQEIGLWALLLKFLSPLKISSKELKSVWMLRR